MRCCAGPRKKKNSIILRHGSIVEDVPDVLETLKRSMNLICTTSNDKTWSVQLSENVRNNSVCAESPDEALRLAQWYAYLDYKELKSGTITNEPYQKIQ